MTSTDILEAKKPKEFKMPNKRSKGNAKGKGRGKGRGKGMNSKGQTSKAVDIGVEHHGVAVIYRKKLDASRIWFKQIDGRLLQICFKTKGPNLTFTNAYAPHTWSNQQDLETVREKRHDFFTKFQDLLLEQQGGNMHIVLGDLKTRIHGTLNGKGDVLGQFVFGRGADFVRNLSRDDKEHRKELITSLHCTEHVVCNPFFQKDSRCKTTRAEIGIAGAPYTGERFSELDLILANIRAKNNVKDVQAITD